MELRIENLTKAYGKKVALEDFTATLSNGIYGLLGPNGAGKSTMMKIITENCRLIRGRSAVYVYILITIWSGYDLLDFTALVRVKGQEIMQKQTPLLCQNFPSVC